MTTMKELPEQPTQLLKPEHYTSEDWLQREYRELFYKTWHFACTTEDLPNAGDFITRKIGNYTLFILRDNNGELKAYHNICRHRGTELLEGKGNAGKTIVCPYHRWTFGLDGRLRGLPDHKECFPGLEKGEHNLIPAALGEMGKLVFVCPQSEPEESFESWAADIPDNIWPHDISAKEMTEFKGDVVYEMQCNWKLFYENAIDGYHLAYLHENTLGGPDPDKNVWDVHGRHLLWYSTERDGQKHRIPQYVEKRVGGWGDLKHVGNPGYPGVYALFPTTIIATTPFAISVSTLEPVSPTVTLLKARTWGGKMTSRFSGGVSQIPGYDKVSGMIKSSHWKKHPLETGDFQTEDIWAVEKMQRSIGSPAYTTANQLAKGAGGEAPVSFFHAQVLDFVEPE